MGEAPNGEIASRLPKGKAVIAYQHNSAQKDKIR